MDELKDPLREARGLYNGCMISLGVYAAVGLVIFVVWRFVR
jgi:hypothetical protein